jgi:hypothetical protein
MSATGQYCIASTGSVSAVYQSIVATGPITVDSLYYTGAKDITIGGNASAGGGNGLVNIALHNTNAFSSLAYGSTSLSLQWNSSQSQGEIDFTNNYGTTGGGGFMFYNRTGGSTNSLLMTLSGNGNVGIGATTPSQLLHIYGSNPTLLIQTSAAGYAGGTGSITFITSTTSYALAQIKAIDMGVSPTVYRGDLVFYSQYNTVLNEAMRIQNGGNVGIGTTNPIVALDNAVGTMYVRPLNTTGAVLSFSGNNGAYGTIECFAPTATGVTSGTKLPLTLNAYGGNVGIGTTNPGYTLTVQGAIYASGDITALSDQRYKQNITSLSNSLNNVSKISGYSYTRTDYNVGESNIGLLAQEVKEVYPEAVHYDTENDMYSINYGCLLAPVIESIKELKATIVTQEKQITLQSEQIQELLRRP